MPERTRSSPSSYVWLSAAELPTAVVRPLPPAKPSPPYPEPLDTGPLDAPFHFSRAMHLLCADVRLHSPGLSHVDPSRMIFGFTQSRNASLYGLQARVTPLRFEGGLATTTRRGKPFEVQRYVVAGVEILYLVEFSLPRFLERSFEQKCITLFHELFHIAPEFNGDLRRHPGRYAFHTADQKQYDREMAYRVREYLSVGSSPQKYDFLRCSFEQLVQRHGSVVGYRIPRPKILPRAGK